MNKDILIKDIEDLLVYLKKPTSQKFIAKRYLESIISNWYDIK